MLDPDEGPIRASAFVNVIGIPDEIGLVNRIITVPPTQLTLANYMSNSTVDTIAGTLLNVTCRSSPSKPAAKLSW